MGVDIHMYIEVKNLRNQWICINPKYLNLLEEPGEYSINQLRIPRNSTLFAILADVRNYSDYIPISEPRGIPEDISNVVRSEYDDWGEDNVHSESYLTLKDLKDYNIQYYGPNLKLIDNLITKIKDLSNEYYPSSSYDDNIRIVFWFDS